MDRLRPASNIATRGQHLCRHVFLANVGLGDVIDRRSMRGGERLRAGVDTLAQKQHELRIVKNANAVRMQNTRHALGVVRLRAMQ